MKIKLQYRWMKPSVLIFLRKNKSYLFNIYLILVFLNCKWQYDNLLSQIMLKSYRIT